jgi:dTDP-4-dehydrorhamnose 3,5-epimerase
MIDGVKLTSLPIINVEGGDVLHVIKSSDMGFNGFGEAYFSTIKCGSIKGWKLHRKMVLNLVVPIGEVKFVIFDDRVNSITRGHFTEIVLSRKNYFRLTIPPKLWVGFKGIDACDSIVLNIANIPHDSNEADHLELNDIYYKWSSKNVEK